MYSQVSMYALSLVGMELISPILALIVVNCVFIARVMLTKQQCFGYC